MIGGGRLAWLIDEQFNSKKEAVRKTRMVGEEIKRRGKLAAIAFCRQFAGRYGSDQPLIPLLTKGGCLAQPTEEQFDWKKLL